MGTAFEYNRFIIFLMNEIKRKQEDMLLVMHSETPPVAQQCTRVSVGNVLHLIMICY